jgi:hypothetical protein
MMRRQRFRSRDIVDTGLMDSAALSPAISAVILGRPGLCGAALASHRCSVRTSLRAQPEARRRRGRGLGAPALRGRRRPLPAAARSHRQPWSDASAPHTVGHAPYAGGVFGEGGSGG